MLNIFLLKFINISKEVSGRVYSPDVSPWLLCFRIMVPKPFLRYFLLFLKAGWDEEAGKERP